MMARAWGLLLVAGCQAPEPVGPEAEDSDVELEETDAPPEEEGEYFFPKDGVVIDQASPSWFAVARQSVVCWLIYDAIGLELNVYLLGMDDGAMHPWVTGIPQPEGTTSFTSGHNIDVRGDELYFSRLHAVRAVNVRTADWLPERVMTSSSFGRYGDLFTDGYFVWPSWDAVGDDVRYGRRFDGGLVATDDETLYLSARDRPELLRVAGPDDRPPKFVMPRVPDATLNAVDIVGLQTVSWWKTSDGRAAVLADGDGRRRARHDLPFSPEYQGIACQPGPLL